LRSLIALIHKDADSDYGVSFPDLPGVVTGGRALTEAAIRSVRVNITLPESLLRDIDGFAAAQGFTRSGFLQAAARRALGGA
jgi:hypothetical protein